MEIFVIDNFSQDDSESIIRAAFDNVTVVQMGYNAGFARANNRGIELSSGDAVLLLNSDTLVHDNTIGELYLKFMNSKYGACGVQLLNADGTPQISGNYFMKGSLNLLLAIPYTGKLLKRAGDLFKVKKPNVPDSNSVVEVDWINGAFLMVKRDVINRVGMLDEDFFLYAEEAEWCHRIRKLFALAIYGQYKVTHLQGVTASDAFNSGGGYSNIFDRKGLQYLLSNFLRIYKQNGSAWYLFNLAVFSLSVPVVFVGSLVQSSQKRKNAIGLAKNVVSLWRYTPQIFSGRKHFYKVL